MSRRPLAPIDARRSGPTTSMDVVRARLFDVDVDRKKRIDDAIDYFGEGRSGVARDLCGESWLDGAGAS